MAGISFSRGTAVSVGGFDGPHRGHAVLCRKVCQYANAHNLDAGVVTFIRSPRVKKTSGYAGDVSTLRLRLRQLEKYGLDFVLLIDFSSDFAKMSGTEFFKILVKTIHMRYLAVGTDFACGYRRDTGVAQLFELSRIQGFGFDSIKKQHTVDGQCISSSAIRDAIAAAAFSQAKTFLGYPFLFDLTGLVKNGTHEGRLTRAALTQVLPPDGQYAAVVYTTQGKKIPVTVMVRPEDIVITLCTPFEHFDAFDTMEFINKE